MAAGRLGPQLSRFLKALLLRVLWLLAVSDSQLVFFTWDLGMGMLYTAVTPGSLGGASSLSRCPADNLHTSSLGAQADAPQDQHLVHIEPWCTCTPGSRDGASVLPQSPADNLHLNAPRDQHLVQFEPRCASTPGSLVGASSPSRSPADRLHFSPLSAGRVFGQHPAPAPLSTVSGPVVSPSPFGEAGV